MMFCRTVGRTTRCGLVTLPQRPKTYAYGMHFYELHLKRPGAQTSYCYSSFGRVPDLLSNLKRMTLHQRNFDCIIIPDGTTVSEFIETAVTDQDDPFFAVDVGRFIRLYNQWKRLLPRVDVFYAMKCNNDPAVLSVLSQLGAGFDCASREEIRTILDLGVPPERIIYANPAKQISYLKYAARSGVHTSTFDSEEELRKTVEIDPEAELVLRIRADDEEALLVLGTKFGATLPEAYHLLDVASDMNAKVIGVSFHVGSGCINPSAYSRAIEMSHYVFEYGKNVGYDFNLLDIGGGFPGHGGSDKIFEDMSCAINGSLQKYFNNDRVTVIAEPGTYFARSPSTLVVNVVNKRLVRQEDGSQTWMYYINEGIFGSLVFYKEFQAMCPPKLVSSSSSVSDRPSTKATMWGPTCDSTDEVISDIFLPEMNIGDWLYFENMGAYTGVVHSPFNGFPKPQSLYYISKSDAAEMFGDATDSEVQSGMPIQVEPGLNL